MTSPLKNKPLTGSQFSTHAESRAIHRQELRLTMDGKTTLISPEQFLEEFVPQADVPLPQELATSLALLPDSSNEVFMYDPLMAALNGSYSDPSIPKLCHNFTFVAHPTKGDKASGSKQAIDCGLYPSDVAPQTTYDDKGKEVKAAVNWSRLQVSIEAKSESKFDPFDDSKPDGRAASDARRNSLGQILQYAEFVFERQQCMFHFMVVIVADKARILRIDRSGIFVTRAFNYKAAGNPLLEFFWRFARLSAEERGEDPTAERVPHDSAFANLMWAKVLTAPKDYVRDLFEKSLDESWDWWLLSVEAEDASGKKLKLRRFLVGKPHFKARGLAGRGTRGYVALDFDNASNGPFVYLKDSWRVVHDDIQKEGRVLETLNAGKVPFIPTLHCHGDLGQTTRSQDLWRKYHPNVAADAPCPLKKHTHYRLAVNEVGKPLQEFKRGYDLVFALYCVLRAHSRACSIGIIHRDISVGNILLFPSRKDGTPWVGMLNDWELSKDIKSKSPVGRQPDRTGTWQFLSAQALTDSTKPIVIPDELESILYILLYLSIRFLPHNCPTKSVGRLLYRLFDDFDIGNDNFICGQAKAHAMATGVIIHDGKLQLQFTTAEGLGGPHPVDNIVREILSWCKAYYGIHYPKNPKTQAADGEVEFMTGTAHWLQDMGDDDWGVPPSASASARPAQTSAAADNSEELARKLETHAAMGELFRKALENLEQWPEKDKCLVDKMPKGGYKPHEDVERVLTVHAAVPSEGSQVGSKRPASEVEAAEPPSTPKRRNFNE